MLLAHAWVVVHNQDGAGRVRRARGADSVDQRLRAGWLGDEAREPDAERSLIRLPIYDKWQLAPVCALANPSHDPHVSWSGAKQIPGKRGRLYVRQCALQVIASLQPVDCEALAPAEGDDLVGQVGGHRNDEQDMLSVGRLHGWRLAQAGQWEVDMKRAAP